MKHYITIALCTFLSQTCTAQVMMLFSQDSLTGIVSPLDVDSLFYWFAADVGVTDSLGGAIATDEGVGTWNDLSGNGHHVTQSTNGARPVYKATGGPGSKPCIQFDGTNDFLASAAHWWGSDDLTVFVVMKFGNATRNATEVVLSRALTTSSLYQFYLQGRGTSDGYKKYGYFFKDVSNYNNYSDGAKQAIYTNATWISDGVSEVKHYTNASLQALTEINVGSWDYTIANISLPLDVGAVNTTGTPGGFLQGSISEIIVFSRALTATERAAIENYLNRKYDLY